MEERQNGSLPVVSPEYLHQWVQSAQQFQALQAQYSGAYPTPHFHNPEGPSGLGPLLSTFHPEAPGQEEEAAQPAKPAAKKRGRPAQPKEPKPPKVPREPKPPKVPKEPKPPKAPKEPKPPKVPKEPKPPKAPKDPNAPKAKPGPKPKKGAGADAAADGKQEKIDENFKKVKRKVDRFKGMTEEEVMKKTLPDLLDYNPGLRHHRNQPGPDGCLHRTLVSGPRESFLSSSTTCMTPHLPGKYRMGFTNMVARATPGSKDLSSKELREGGKILVEKLKKFKPLIAVFNGKCIYEMFCRELFGKKPQKLEFGLQPHKIPDCDVRPCAQFPRAQDKVHFYINVRELRDQLKGVERRGEIEEVAYSFDLDLAKEDAKRMAIKEEQYDPGYEDATEEPMQRAELEKARARSTGTAPSPQVNLQVRFRSSAATVLCDPHERPTNRKGPSKGPGVVLPPPESACVVCLQMLLGRKTRRQPQRAASRTDGG
ncbi:unnamed protein product [Tetraodon nigroviridis]|uniref:G/T mismatch-specific thymine DNA glycosylase n=1 Tax=Tetraodon nigroviridis TaxID=99883 RepID=Q4T9X4_TETNG|nr:unnamed protein product [Tetraodon nigroviridis]